MSLPSHFLTSLEASYFLADFTVSSTQSAKRKASSRKLTLFQQSPLRTLLVSISLSITAKYLMKTSVEFKIIFKLPRNKDALFVASIELSALCNPPNTAVRRLPIFFSRFLAN